MRTEVAELLEDGTKRDQRGRRMTPREQRAVLVGAFHDSGLTQAAFARREGLNAKTLSHWVKAGAGRRSGASGAMRFARVSVPDAMAGLPARLEVALADGTIVRGGEVRAVAELVRALRD